MRIELNQLKLTLEKQAYCSLCFSYLLIQKRNSSCVYCQFNLFFHNIGAGLSFSEFPQIMKFIECICRKTEILLNISLNHNSDTPEPIIDQPKKAYYLKLSQKLNLFRKLLRQEFIKQEDLWIIEKYIIFYLSPNYVPFNLFFSDPFPKFKRARLENNQMTQSYIEESFIRIDSKINPIFSYYTEDDDYLCISDCNKIFLYDLKSNKFLMKLTGNCCSRTALVPKEKKLVYQNKDYDIVVFNILEKVQEFSFILNSKVKVEYYKISSFGKYLFTKFESNQMAIWNMKSKKKVYSKNQMGALNFVLTNKKSEIILFSNNIILHNFKKEMESENLILIPSGKVVI